MASLQACAVFGHEQKFALDSRAGTGLGQTAAARYRSAGKEALYTKKDPRLRLECIRQPAFLMVKGEGAWQQVLDNCCDDWANAHRHAHPDKGPGGVAVWTCEASAFHAPPLHALPPCRKDTLVARSLPQAVHAATDAQQAPASQPDQTIVVVSLIETFAHALQRPCMLSRGMVAMQVWAYIGTLRQP